MLTESRNSCAEPRLGGGKTQIAKRLGEESENEFFGVAHRDLRTFIHGGPDPHRPIQFKRMVFEAELSQRPDPADGILARGARAIEQALDAVDAERLGGRAEIRVEIRKMMIETAGRDVEPAGKLREFTPDTPCSRNIRARIQSRRLRRASWLSVERNNMVTGSRVLLRPARPASRSSIAKMNVRSGRHPQLQCLGLSVRRGIADARRLWRPTAGRTAVVAVVAGDVVKIIDPQRAGAMRRVADDHGRLDGRGRVADDAWSSSPRPLWPAEDWDGRAAGFSHGRAVLSLGGQPAIFRVRILDWP